MEMINMKGIYLTRETYCRIRKIDRPINEKRGEKEKLNIHNTIQITGHLLLQALFLSSVFGPLISSISHFLHLYRIMSCLFGRRPFDNHPLILVKYGQDWQKLRYLPRHTSTMPIYKTCSTTAGELLIWTYHKQEESMRNG